MALYVTDTHPLLWYANRQAKLSGTALHIFERADAGETLIYIPAMVLLECAILEKIGRIRAKDSFEIWAKSLVALPGFELLPLEIDIMFQAIAMQSINDPFDMCIVATARSRGLPLITTDQIIVDSALVEIAW